MEHEKIEGMAKKIWKIVKVALLMLRKGICKRKILLDLSIMIKRGKLAGKSIRNLILLHHHNHPRNHRRQVSAAEIHRAATPAADPDSDSDEVSCTTSPLHDSHAVHEEVINSKVLLESMVVTSSRSEVSASPLVGFRRSSATRQLRITDSPFPLQNDPEENRRVNQAAEDFIKRFYSQLKRQQD